MIFIGCAVIVVQILVGAAQPRMRRTDVMLFFSIPAIVVGLIYLLSPRPMRVQVRDGHLHASDFRREIEILPGDIASVTQNIWDRVRPITIHLRERSELGSRIRFLPHSHVVLRFRIEDPVVDELRTFARAGPVSP